MLKTIEIDFDVHKMIEAERRGFDDTDNDILRRLLGLGETTAEPDSPDGNPAWAGKGVILPHGTLVRMAYQGVMHDGSIQDGKWAVGLRREKSPSAAARSVTGTSVNGWAVWEVKRPGDPSFIPLQALRK